MTNRRNEILRATKEAAHVALKFPVTQRTSFDIVGAVSEMGIPLMFRPLKGLWGATVTVDDEAQGILVTSKLDLHVQRFTLAHELGHIQLGHKVSFDETIGFTGRFGASSRPVEEIAADTFASELLAPKALMQQISAQHKWTRDALTDPKNVYQLSLRLGVSFPAACWALASHSVITEPRARTLQDQPVKDLKHATAPAALLSNPWANVWNLSEADSGTLIEAGPDDIFAVCLVDHSSSGYLWQLVDTSEAARVLEETTAHASEKYGAHNPRTIFLHFEKPGRHQLVFAHRRPWNNQELARIDILIEDYGKELGGFARRAREAALVVEAS